MKALRNFVSQLIRYPTAIAGLALIFLFIMLAAIAPLFMSYNDAIEHWRGTESVVGENPRNAKPLWANWFRREKLPRTINLNSEDPTVETVRTELSDDLWETVTTYEFEYTADKFPNELTLFFTAEFDEKPPFVEMEWIKPNGDEIKAGQISPTSRQQFRFTQDEKVMRKLDSLTAEEGFFLDPNSGEDDPKPLKGTYTLIVTALHFEEASEIGTKFISFGDVHGWAGTDHRRRDITVAMLWGAPIAMAFGLVASLTTTLFGLIVAAIGVWHGRWIDGLIQRINDIAITLPFLVILIMIGTLYSRSIWVILTATIILSLFSAGLRSNRALFLQMREAGYIEAAQTYGAGSNRIIFRYLIPRVLPLMVPSLISAVPTFVFIEATLAVFNLGDPILPTWGKVINDAFREGAVLNGHYYWIVQPAILLFILGFGFTMLGTALDRIFNPKLREI